LEDAWYEREFCASSEGKERWLADTGATTHITMNDKYMTDIETVKVTVIVGDGKEVLCTKRGNIIVSNGESSMLLQGVLYTPDFHKNIVSIGQFVKKGGCEVLMRGSTLSLRKEDSEQELTFRCDSTSVLYYFEGNRMSSGETVLVSDDATTSNSDGNKQDAQQNTLPLIPKTPSPEPTDTSDAPKKKPKKTPQDIDINDAHDKYGHIGEAALRATLKSIGLEPTGTLLACSGCAQAKARAKNIPKFTSLKATSPGERMYTDISGPYKKSLIGSNYWILFVDQYSGKAWSFFVPRKNMMAKVANKLFTQLKSAGYTIRFLRCDNAGENVAGLSKVCETHGIKEEFTAPHTPQQNGVVERKFVTIRDRACAAMYAAKLSDEYHGLLWAESVHTHTRLTNSVANSATNKCPDWLFYGKQPTLYPHLVQFGRVGWVAIRTKIPKLTPKAIKCIMLGYSHNHAADTYRMYNLTTKKVIDSRDITWAEWHGNAKITADMPG
jgi:hypothetical protein